MGEALCKLFKNCFLAHCSLAGWGDGGQAPLPFKNRCFGVHPSDRALEVEMPEVRFKPFTPQEKGWDFELPFHYRLSR